MIKSLLRYFSKKTHDIRYQLLIGSLYGCIELYGVRGTILIMMKARKLQPPKKVRRSVKSANPENIAKL